MTLIFRVNANLNVVAFLNYCLRNDSYNYIGTIVFIIYKAIINICMQYTHPIELQVKVI